MSNLDSIPYDDTSKQLYSELRILFGRAEAGAMMNLSGGRYKKHALLALEESFLWVGKALKDDQLKRETPSDPSEDTPWFP